MPSREPSSIYEKRVDFAAIERNQELVNKHLLSVLRKILSDMERHTLRWVETNLAKKKLKTAINKFELPYTPRYRAAMRRWLASSTKAGAKSVARELELPSPELSTRELSRVRARADALTDEHLNRLTSDLNREWAQAMFGNVDSKQLRYVTKRVFADFAGWEQPDGIS
jgi:hypothetical protein